MRRVITYVVALSAAMTLLPTICIFAQEGPSPGEVFATRFSGTITQAGRSIIDVNGAVGSIIDVRVPGRPPRGESWLNAPQRLSVTAGEIGQVFGIAFDDSNPANIYLTATSAFGLHRTPDNTNWMAGMWGREGGPGTIWKLAADNNYRPQIFAQITLDGRSNTGVALGAIVFDRWNRQFYVSDLETGMIHRLRLDDGADLARYDHGTQGRANFTDITTGARQALPPVAFDPATRARISDCAAGTFAQHPSCWNFADFRRRVWGLGVRRDQSTGEVRLYYSIWASQGFGDPAWFTARDDQRNAIWSVRIAAGGDFDPSDVRREFILPNFFSDPAQTASLGASHPVADIAFPKSGDQGVMLLAERGGVRNLGLGATAPFARPHESRVLRYERDPAGRWQPSGRYDVGFYDRKNDGQPYLRANASGGVDFGFGYSSTGQADPAEPDQFVWMTGDRLCAPEAPCSDRAGGAAANMQVHGLQGTSLGRLDEVMPAAALQPYPAQGYATPSATPGASFMIDTDINTDGAGAPIVTKIARNDATKIGGVKVFAPAPAAPPPVIAMPGRVPPAAGAGVPFPGAEPGIPPGEGAIEAAPPPLPSPPGFGEWGGPGPPSPPGFGKWEGPGAAPPLPPPGAGEWGGPGAKPPSPPAAGDFFKPDVLGLLGGLGVGVVPIPVPGVGDGAPAAPATGPDIVVRKKGTATCQPGERCDFVITIEGAHTTAFTGTFTVTDTPPAGWTFAAGAEVLGLWTCQTGATVCTYDVAKNPNVPKDGFKVGDTLGVGIGFLVPSNAKDGTYQNCVTVKLLPPATGEKKACASVVVGQQPKLTISKTFDSNVCAPGEECNFTITVKNEGKGDYTGLLMVPDFRLPTGTSFFEESGAAGMAVQLPPNCLMMGGEKPMPGTSVWPAFTCLERSLAAGEKKEFRFTGFVSENYPSGTEIRNCATVPLLGTDPDNLSSSDRLVLVRHLLALAGYPISKKGPSGVAVSTDPLTDAEQQALSDYKKKNSITDAQGKPDTSGEITDQLLKTLLPKVADASGENSIAACDTVTIKQPGLVIKKAHHMVAAPDKPQCYMGEVCGWEIVVMPRDATPYTKPIRIEEQLPPDWSLVDYGPKGATAWTCTGQNKVVCTHPPANLSQDKVDMLALNIWAKTTKLGPGKYPEVKNCAKVLYDDSQQYVLERVPSDPYLYWEACDRQKIAHPDLANFDFVAGSSGPCWPPGCSFYEFTATQRENPYRGPLTIRITPPAGSVFPEARVTRSTKSCPASGWSCTKSGSGSGTFTCRIADCTFEPNDQVTVKIEGSVAPDLKEPPPVQLEKTACGILEWQTPPGAVDIEQRGTSKQACATIIVMAKRPAVPRPTPPPIECTGGKIVVGNRCVCPPNTIDLRRRCVACPGGKVAVGNRCVCPSGTIERRGTCVQPSAPAPVQPRPLQPQLLCLGGKVAVGNRCVCPANTIEMRGRCVARQAIPRPAPAAPPQFRPQVVPAPIAPRLQTVPGTIVCPQGTKLIQGRCMPIIR